MRGKVFRGVYFRALWKQTLSAVVAVIEASTIWKKIMKKKMIKTH